MSLPDVVPEPDARGKLAVALVGVSVGMGGQQILDAVVSLPAGLSRAIRWGYLLGREWLVAGVVLGVVVGIERRGVDSIGIERPGWRELGLAAIGFAVGVASFALTQPLVRALGLATTNTGIAAFGSLPTWFLASVVLTAAVTEEVVYRGYPIERLTELTGRLWLGASLTVLVFTAVHVPFWGVGGALQIGVWTVVVTALYVKTRNLVACMVMHIANNLFAYLLLPHLLG